MRDQHHRLPLYGTIAAALLAAAGSAAPAAADPLPIGPQQYFSGLVNDVSDNAVIKVVCPGPVGGDRTGHPVSGQSVAVAPSRDSGDAIAGYTGDAADHIVVDFGVVSTTKPTTLAAYSTKADIPTDLSLPCSGTGEVTFVPAPTSDTARSDVVTVTYENIAL